MKTAVSSADWLAYAATRLGRPGLLGLACLLAAGLVWQALLPPLRQATLETRAEAERLAARPKPTATVAAAAAPPQAALPPAGEAPRILGGLFKAATHAGLVLEEGNYRAGSEGASGIVKQQITLPLQGAYPALRGFVAEALAGHPSLVLEGLNLSRQEMTAGQLEANLRFTLYLRAPEATP